MLDLKWIRENAQRFDEAMGQRNSTVRAEALLRLDEERRSHLKSLQDLQSQRNDASKEIGRAKASGDAAKADEVMARVADLKSRIQDGEARERDLDARIAIFLAAVPNIPFDEVPVGADETDNVEVRRVGTKPSFDFKPKEHFEIGEALGLMDFDRAAKIAGSRFTVLRGAMARLERALGQFMIDIHTREFGYEEVSPPLLVREDAAFGTGNLPKFAEDLFQTTDGRWLIPTAEISLTNLVREEITEEAKLPLRFTALTPSFRSEAGSAGRDTRGMLRQHQFYKAELVSVTTAETALEEHERMTRAAETVLERLGLHFRTVVLCTGDMGFASRKTYDIEVWLPGQDAFREISSCSVCGDFQARRMNARYRPAGEKQAPRFVNTLNGSGTAVGRALIAVVENYQNADGSVTVPDVLRPYMNGLERIG
ncbi:serine--tRNA ligase [Aureimonas jatrophae]|uniref:Serine--tRNA ligase n=1 Tax=Aureimonas jatrophae TaxID=1166073 RepID=A0A1H0MUF2_9HYPH|nr:serine--tRNA ligase [Aureimonas jatrophae]MBB3951219.1 seryl-tRNA synthetase [Aureimonas jatrophae]SDO83925.1 seryl-tRNA synthetase [Aureimonas jatrophae]